MPTAHTICQPLPPQARPLLPLSFAFLPYIWQRMYMARSASHVAKNLVAVPIIFIVLFFTTWVIGSSAHTLLPEGLKDADRVLGALFSDKAPYFGALLLGAAFAAGMSTVGAIIGVNQTKAYWTNFCAERQDIAECKLIKTEPQKAIGALIKLGDEYGSHAAIPAIPPKEAEQKSN